MDLFRSEQPPEELTEIPASVTLFRATESLNFTCPKAWLNNAMKIKAKMMKLTFIFFFGILKILILKIVEKNFGKIKKGQKERLKKKGRIEKENFF